MEEKKLFLLDAYALIYRAYYALLRSPRVTSAGMNTSAIFGFVNTLEDVIRKENPGYLAVCFDPAHGRTFRHEQYPEYKAGRDKQPEDITIAIPYIKEILKAMRISVVEVEGYEADDVIGTLSVRAAAEGFTTYMMTPDKDYGQLVTDRTFMYRPALKGQGFEVRGPQQICERYGIQSPRQVIDLLALEGDASDNVPGCPGVGEKTAAKLIAEYGSVEGLLDNIASLKGALQRKIADHADQIRMSKDLVTICTDAPVTDTPESLRRREPDIPALLEIYDRLEFRSFAARYRQGDTSTAANTASAPQPKPSQPSIQGSLFDFDDSAPAQADTPEASTATLTAPEAISDYLQRAIAHGNVGLAVDTDGAPEAMTATARGIAMAYLAEDANGIYEAVYIPVSEDLPALLAPLFADRHVTIVGPDIKRDMLVLRRMGVQYQGAHYFDTAVAHYLCQPEMKHDIGTLALRYLGQELTPDDTTQTVVAALRLRPMLEKEVARKGQKHLLTDVELPLVAVLAGMEWEGARIDTAELHALSRQLTARLADLESKAYELAGHPFNVSSPSQVGQILFEELRIDPKAKRTKGGAWSTAEDVLEKYRKDVPLVQLILDIRGLKKLLATYIDALPRLINPATGKIHTTYNQTVTSTGRISSTNPNLQNIPIRTADGRDIRRAFVADPGCLLLSADYSQIELRLMADLSGDQGMIDAFLSGADIHRATAAKIYHEALEDVTDEQRRNAKTANFGIIYGISAFGLSERLGIPRGEAKELIDGYLSTYPAVAEYMNKAIEQARTDGFVSTIMGRRRYLPDITSRSNTVRSYAERNAINAPLQGSAADIIKVAMVDIDRRMAAAGLRSRMIMQVHDELIFNVIPDELATLQTIVIEGMAGAYHGRVPLEVAAGTGLNWIEAH